MRLTKRSTGIFLIGSSRFRCVINNIAFLPWEYTTFVTPGANHAIIIWTENDENKMESNLQNSYTTWCFATL